MKSRKKSATERGRQLKTEANDGSAIQDQKVPGVQAKLKPEEINRLWQHGMHEDKMFNDRLNFFLIFESVLLGVVGSLYGKQPSAMKPILVVLAILGLALTIIWSFIQAKQRSTLKTLMRLLEDNLPEFKETWDELRTKKWRRVSGTWVLTYLIPFLVAVVWIALLLLFVKGASQQAAL